MTFIVTLIAMLIERFFDWGHLRSWRWYGALERLSAKQWSHHSPWLVLAVTIVPVLLVVAVLSYILHGVLYGFLLLVFKLFILLYSIGPRNLWADAFSAINALENNQAVNYSDQFKQNFGVVSPSNTKSTYEHFLGAIFTEANTRIFAVIFWFVLCGPVGAVLYRTIVLSAGPLSQGRSAGVADTASRVKRLLDWLPVRAFTFLFALGGHFVDVIISWRAYLFLGPVSNGAMLVECGKAAIGAIGDKAAFDGQTERHALALLDRCFVIMLVLIAFEVIII